MIDINFTNFVTIGLMAMVFFAGAEWIKHKFLNKPESKQ